MKNILSKLSCLLVAAIALSSCSAKYLSDINTDKTKPTSINPNAQLTTGLLQTYGDFSVMDTYRCYITGFTQYYAGGWNVSNYAGAVHADNDMMSRLWDQFYSVGIKNIVDAIYNSRELPNVNAILRIHRVYMMSVLTDTYGDVPCMEAGLGKLEGIANPKYDTQESIYNWFFEELKACIDQIMKNEKVELVTGDVTNYGGNALMWAKYANSLRLRFAMRISDVNPQKAQAEFAAALADPAGIITISQENAFVKHIDGPFTLYDGARDLDFRVNALNEMLYGQDATSPTFICHTLFWRMKKTNDPRLYRICRHYINTKRSQIKADNVGNHDLTDDVVAYQNSEKGQSNQQSQAPGFACYVGAAWYSDWVNNPAEGDIPGLDKLVAEDPEAGYNKSNFDARLLRPFLALELEQGDCPGILMTSAEVHFLLAEAASKGWTVPGTVEENYVKGVTDAMLLLNEYYKITPISIEEIEDYLAANPVGSTAEKQKEAINTQAWILHLTNPSEGWANLRRSDYPVMDDRSKYKIKDFTSDSDNLTTPLRLRYPNLESKYNKQSYEEAVARIEGGVDDWHKPVWWDVKPTNVDHEFYLN